MVCLNFISHCVYGSSQTTITRYIWAERVHHTYTQNIEGLTAIDYN